jgi:hypothetical protein
MIYISNNTTARERKGKAYTAVAEARTVVAEEEIVEIKEVVIDFDSERVVA